MKFQVYKDGDIDESFKLCGAYLFGSDGITIRGNHQITCKKGLIKCKKSTVGTAGLALLWPVKGFGRIMLQATCLSEQAEPYNLNLELARAKLMQIINKREDWSIFGNTEDSQQDYKKSRELFIAALQNISDPSAASKLADQCLEKAVLFAENLAEAYAQNLFNIRIKNRTLRRTTLGCGIDPKNITKKNYIPQLLESFAHVKMPINWAVIEKQKGVYDFDDLDRCIEVLSQKRVAISASPLICFQKCYIPKWLYGSDPGFEKIAEAAYRFISNIVSRYSTSVHSWIVISGMNSFNHFGFRFEHILEMTRSACLAAKAASERSIKLIEICLPWGEYYAKTPNTIPPLVYLDMAIQSGINFDGFALSMPFGRNQPGLRMRDMMQISAMIDYFSAANKPLHITGIAVPDNSEAAQQTPDVAGLWRKPWTQQQQAKWIETFYRIALSKPLVNSITYTSFADGDEHVVVDSGLLTDDMKPKKAIIALKKLQKSILTHQ